uniref:Reverse transcriptase domain-containing protein n=1 Tax=Romanomermis culicivorax TaxID=13658 RepID=A0A915IX20_ROMCU
MLTDTAIPVSQPVRQVPITRRAAVEKEVKQMVTDVIWEQCLVWQTFAGWEGCSSYLDDILVFHSTAMQHDEQLRALLQRLSDKDFRLNMAKTSDIEHQHQAQPKEPPWDPKCADPAVDHPGPQFPWIHQLPPQIFATSCQPC